MALDCRQNTISWENAVPRNTSQTSPAFLLSHAIPLSGKVKPFWQNNSYEYLSGSTNLILQ